MINVTTKYLAITLLCGFISTPLYADDKDDEREYEVKLYPLNGSGVYGEAEITIKGTNVFKISLEADGLEANKLHPQHIHGLTDSIENASCPDISADVDGDGLISVGEGLPFYGPIVLPLTPFDLVVDNGELDYDAKFTINPESVQPIGKRTIVLHGMTVNGQYIASLPIACGTIELDD